MKEDKEKLFVKKSECSVKTCAHFLKEVLKKEKDTYICCLRPWGKRKNSWYGNARNGRYCIW